MKVASAINVLFIITLFAYPFEEKLRLVENLSIIDIVVFLLSLIIINHRTAYYSKIMKEKYGATVTALIATMSMSIFFSESPSKDFIFVAQLAFVFLILIPTFIISFQFFNLERLLLFYLSFYTLLHTIGYILAIYFGIDLLVADSGNGRFFPSFVYANSIASGYFLANALIKNNENKKDQTLLNMLMLFLSLINMITLGSRSALLGFSLAIVFLLVISIRHLILNRKAIIIIAFMITALLTYDISFIIENLFTRNLGGESISEDSFRYDANKFAMEQIMGNIKFVFIGVGHENGIVLGDALNQAQPVHNKIIQMAYEFGIISSVLLLIFLSWPLADFVKRRKANNLSILTASMVIASLGFIIFHPISSQRVIWVGYAIIWSSFYYEKLKQRNFTR